MASKTISAWEARRNFGKLMDEVVTKNRPVIVESRGEAKVAVVPIRIAEAIERDRQWFFDMLRTSAEEANFSEEEAMEFANELVAEVRAERRAAKAG